MDGLPDWLNEKPITLLEELAAQAEPQPPTAPADDLLTKVRHLAACQRALAEAKAMYNAAFEAFLIDHELLVGQKDRCIADVMQAEDAVRDMAVAAWQADPSCKALAPGVNVRTMTRLVYDDAEAFAWAVKHGLALALDRKVFEGIARVQRPAFVQVTSYPVACVATDLDKALHGDELPEG